MKPLEPTSMAGLFSQKLSLAKKVPHYLKPTHYSNAQAGFQGLMRTTLASGPHPGVGEELHTDDSGVGMGEASQQQLRQARGGTHMQVEGTLLQHGHHSAPHLCLAGRLTSVQQFHHAGHAIRLLDGEVHLQVKLAADQLGKQWIECEYHRSHRDHKQSVGWPSRHIPYGTPDGDTFTHSF